MSNEESLVEQVQSLYAEREELVKAFGTAEAESLIGRVRELETTIASLVEQVQSFYAEREESLAAPAT